MTKIVHFLFVIVSAAFLISGSCFTAYAAEYQYSCKSTNKGYCVNLITPGMAVSDGQKNQNGPYSSREFATAHEVVIPGLEFLKLDTTSIGDILDSLYKFGLGFVGIAALAMFTISGVQYMFAGEKDPTNAKKRMQNALLGLVLAFTSWLILYEINPALVGKLRVFNELEKLETPKFKPEGPTIIDTPIKQGDKKAVEDCASRPGAQYIQKNGELFCEYPQLYEISQQEGSLEGTRCLATAQTVKVIVGKDGKYYCPNPFEKDVNKVKEPINKAKEPDLTTSGTKYCNEGIYVAQGTEPIQCGCKTSGLKPTTKNELCPLSEILTCFTYRTV